MSARGNIFFLMNQEFSAFNASFRLASDLQSYGYRVVYWGYAGLAENVLKQDFEFEIIDYPQLEWDNNELSWSSVKARIEYKTAMYGVLRKMLKKEHPDLVVLSSHLSEYCIPFLEEKLPLIIFNCDLGTTVNLSVPPVFSHIVPGKSRIAGPVWNTLAWLSIYGRILRYDMKYNAALFLKHGFTFYRYHEKRMIRALGVKCSWGEYGMRLDQPEIVCVPAHFDFPWSKDLKKRCYIGVSMHVRREHDSDLPPGNGAPLIYCSLGSHLDIEDKTDFFQSVIEAFHRLPHLQLIMQVNGGEKIVKSYGSLPPNVSVHTWVPQMEVLSRASAFITHGGMSSVKEALFFGVPMIVFPYVNDQPGNAARIRYHNLGLVGDPENVSPDIIVRLVNSVLEDHRLRESVANMREKILMDEDSSIGVNFIEEHLLKARQACY